MVKTVLNRVYSNKLKILKEMDDFLNKFHLPKLNETKEINLNRHKHLGKQNLLQVCHQYEPKAMSFRVVLPDFQRGFNNNTPQCIQ